MRLSKGHIARCKQTGVAAIEFALLLPVLLLILFGIINYGVIMYDQAVVVNAAREGARWASIHSVDSTCTTTTPTNPCQVAYSYASGSMISFGSGSNVTVTFNASTYTSGSPMTVTVRYAYKGIGWYFGGTTTNMSSSAVMLHE